MFTRTLVPSLDRQLGRGKSILLLGPRQVGKTTLLKDVPADLRLLLTEPRQRQKYEKDPSILSDEILGLKKKRPLIIVDEVQKVPELLNVAQGLIDSGTAQFILTGSSARKLRRDGDINLLPGRVVNLRLDPLTIQESLPESLNEALTEGALPAIRAEKADDNRELDLGSYVETYLEQEVRQEALVKRMAPFARFLELAAVESGRITNFSSIASEVGVSAPTVQQYFEILVDCLVAERIEPITHSATRKKLTKSCRYMIFDLGVRRLAALEGSKLGSERLGELFEQMIGLELIRLSRLHLPGAKLRFWRDPDGPEVDWVLEHQGGYLPIGVKFTQRPQLNDARHLQQFMREYPQAKHGLIFCRADKNLQLSPNITAIPWTHLSEPSAWLKM